MWGQGMDETCMNGDCRRCHVNQHRYVNKKLFSIEIKVYISLQIILLFVTLCKLNESLVYLCVFGWLKTTMEWNTKMVMLVTAGGDGHGDRSWWVMATSWWLAYGDGGGGQWWAVVVIVVVVVDGWWLRMEKEIK